MVHAHISKWINETSVISIVFIGNVVRMKGPLNNFSYTLEFCIVVVSELFRCFSMLELFTNKNKQ